MAEARDLVFVGSWTEGRHGTGSGGGIVAFAAIPEAGTLERLGEFGRGLSVGHLSLAADGRHLYAVDERRDRGGDGGGGVATFSLSGGEGVAELEAVVPTLGPLPCFVGADPRGELALVANHGSYDFVLHAARGGGADGPGAEAIYDDGIVTLLAVEDGVFGEVLDLALLDHRPGPDPVRQRSPHPHSAIFDPAGRFAIVCDKGGDAIYVFEVDRAGRRLVRRARHEVEAGRGPRHPIFHPSLPVLYVTHELRTVLEVFAFDPATGEISSLQSVATVAPGFEGANDPADLCVHPDGGFLYATNRGEDTVACFAIGDDGLLTAAGSFPCAGRTPRGVAISPDGGLLAVANQDSHSVSMFSVDSGTGALRNTFQAAAPRPECVAFGSLSQSRVNVF